MNVRSKSLTFCCLDEKAWVPWLLFRRDFPGLLLVARSRPSMGPTHPRCMIQILVANLFIVQFSCASPLPACCCSPDTFRSSFEVIMRYICKHYPCCRCYLSVVFPGGRSRRRLAGDLFGGASSVRGGADGITPRHGCGRKRGGDCLSQLFFFFFCSSHEISVFS